MSKRICSQCGKEKEIKGGKVCEKGHFICKDCVYEGSGIIFTYEKSKCPICNKNLN